MKKTKFNNQFSLTINGITIDYSKHMIFKNGAWTIKGGSKRKMIKKYYPNFLKIFDYNDRHLNAKFEYYDKLIKKTK